MVHPAGSIRGLRYTDVNPFSVQVGLGRQSCRLAAFTFGTIAAMRFIAPLVLALALAGCATKTTTPGTPVPVVANTPAQNVAATNKLLADSANSTVKIVIQLRGAGKVSAADTTAIENWCGVVANTSLSIANIQAATAPWATQKTQILTLLATVTAPSIASTADPQAAQAIAGIVGLFSQIKGQLQ